MNTKQMPEPQSESEELRMEASAKEIQSLLTRCAHNNGTAAGVVWNMYDRRRASTVISDVD